MLLPGNTRSITICNIIREIKDKIEIKVKAKAKARAKAKAKAKVE